MKGEIICISGGSQNGKTTYAFAELQRREREGIDKFVAWDVDAEYSDLRGWRSIKGLSQLISFIKNNGINPVKIAYHPVSNDDFDSFCLIVRAWGKDISDISCGRDGLVVVCEETADVTTPSKAPNGYGQLIRRCKKRGIFLYCLTQRPAESSKTPYGNANFLVTFHLPLISDRKSVCEYFGTSSEKLDEIKRYHYLKKDIINRDLIEGKVEKN